MLCYIGGLRLVAVLMLYVMIYLQVTASSMLSFVQFQLECMYTVLKPIW